MRLYSFGFLRKLVLTRLGGDEDARNFLSWRNICSVSSRLGFIIRV